MNFDGVWVGLLSGVVSGFFVAGAAWGALRAEMRGLRRDVERIEHDSKKRTTELHKRIDHWYQAHGVRDNA